MFLKIWEEIKRKKFAPLYLLYGKENFLIQETQNLIVREALDDSEIDLNFNQYDMEQTPVELAIEDCETIPFFGERKVVILQNAYFLTSEKAKEKVEHNLKVLESYLANPVPTTILVVVAPYEKLDERKKIVKALKKNSVVLDAKELSERDTKRWVKEYITEQHGFISNDALERLFQLIGSNLSILNNEISKLLLYSNGEEIDLDMVENMVTKSTEENVFTLVEKVLHNKLDEVLEIYRDLLKRNEEPIKILAIIASNLRVIYQVKSLQKHGFGQKQIAGLLKIHPYRVKLAMERTGGFSEQKIFKMIDALAEMDFKMKTGGGNKEKLLELFFLKFIKQK